MSIFSTTDVLSPIERRKALVQKLMGQYGASAQAAQQMQMPAAAGAGGHPGASGVGSPFHNGGSSLLGPRTSVTNTSALSDIAPDVQRGLGPGGFHIPLPFESSGFRGGPVSAPGLGDVNAPSQLPPGHGGGPVGAAGGALPLPGVAPQAQQGNANNSAFTPNPVGQAQAVGLGNGMYFDPVSGSIQSVAGGAVPGMGDIAKQLATGAPVNLGPGRTLAF